MATSVTCSVCKQPVQRGPNGFGLISHANKHRREFIETFGREPADYQEVRDQLSPHASLDADNAQVTLHESLTDDDQQTFPVTD